MRLQSRGGWFHGLGHDPRNTNGTGAETTTDEGRYGRAERDASFDAWPLGEKTHFVDDVGCQDGSELGLRVLHVIVRLRRDGGGGGSRFGPRSRGILDLDVPLKHPGLVTLVGVVVVFCAGFACDGYLVRVILSVRRGVRAMLLDRGSRRSRVSGWTPVDKQGLNRPSATYTPRRLRGPCYVS